MRATSTSPLFQRRRPGARSSLVAAGLMGLLASGALAQQPGGAPPAPAAPPAPPQVMLVAERAGMAQWFVSPKDQAFAEALGMIPARFDELRTQVPDMGKIPPAIFQLIPAIIAGPARLAVTNKGFDQQTGMPGIGAVVSFACADEAGAKAFMDSIQSFRADADMPFQTTPSKRYPGMSEVPLPFGVLSYGPRRADDAWRFEVLFAAIDNPDAPFASLPSAPAGVAPVLRASLDLAAWSPIISMFAGMAAMGSPQGQQVLTQLRQNGVLGSDAIAFDLTAGYAPDYGVWTLNVHKAAQYAAAWGTSKEPITPAELAIIPRDASFAVIKHTDLKHSWESMKAQFASAGPEPLRQAMEQFKAATGLDLEADVISTLGDTNAFYFADSTGGGSLLSGVALLRLADPVKFSASLDRLVGAANGFLKQQVPPPAAIEVARMTRGSVTFTQLRFPGLPVPLEPTVAIVGSWAVIGATPQAAIVGARHVEKPEGAGLADNAAFKAARWSLPSGAQPIALTFIDTPRTLRDGYATLTLLGSAVSNLARSRSDAANVRDPGLVIPAMDELAQGARGMLSMTYWAGNDLVTESRGDRSALVNLAGMLGTGDASPFIGGAILGSVLGARIAQTMPVPPPLHAEPQFMPHEDGDQDHQPPAPVPVDPKKQTPY